MAKPVFVLGGYQTDFARNWSREGLALADLFAETFLSGLEATELEAGAIESAHVGNFTAELFCRQGQLGGFFAAAAPEMFGVPASRHEAACASGSMALLAAMAEIEAERYGLVAVLGVEMMRNVSGGEAALNIGGPAMWSGREDEGLRYPWPHMFALLGDEYEARYGLKREHLAEISRINFENAKRNPNAQTRKWRFSERSFTEDDGVNPPIAGRIRRHDCGQVSDGAAVVFLAGERAAAEYAQARGKPLESLPRIMGWGHSTGHISYQPKIERSRGQEYVFPHVRRAVMDAFGRAGVGEASELDGFEVHDCFSTTEYMAIDHLGLTAPGESWKAVEDGRITLQGDCPVNPSGGLIGLGHPVGATGVRMMLDCAKQVTGRAGDYQVDGAKRFGMLNLGGSATTIASFVLGV